MNPSTTPLPLRPLFTAAALALLLALPTGVKATTALKIDLIAGTNLSTVDRTYTYNLGDYQLQGQSRTYYDHRSNGKDGLAAVMFACMDNKPVQTQYFSRMALAGYNGEAYGHTGQGFSYLWTMLGANMGGQLAVQEYHKDLRWDRT